LSLLLVYLDGRSRLPVAGLVGPVLRRMRRFSISTPTENAIAK
jgi:hypothetical protein